MILSGDNAALLEDLYEQFKDDPASVDRSWADYFRELENGHGGRMAFTRAMQLDQIPGGAGDIDRKQLGVQALIASYRRFGQKAANLDPLGLMPSDRAVLDIARYGLSESDFESKFESGIPALGTRTLREIIDWMEKTYCSSIGVEHSYIRVDEERDWLEETMESTANNAPLPTWIKLRLFEKV
ncbi:MAG: 2-oxoglutarate dehydrogenase E1 component, partial [Leptospiraceae bacterium]|nr:2-oxoglutarate dehydrogenase E1 component [Leptospiraceae bacterium]